MLIGGKVVKGIGKAKEIVPKYKNEIKNILLNDPYPGTLNVAIDKEIRFKTWFGKKNKVWYVKGLINGVDVIIVRPKKSKHPKNIIEIISTWHLRTLLNLKDRNKVMITIQQHI